MIRSFLLMRGSGYPRQVYRHLKKYLEMEGYKPPRYESVRKMFYVLHELGLIEPIRKESVEGYPKAMKRIYYRVVPGTERRPEWDNPYSALYSPEKFKKQRIWVRGKVPKEWMDYIRGLKKVK